MLDPYNQLLISTDDITQKEQTKQTLEDEIYETMTKKFVAPTPTIPGMKLCRKQGAEILPILFSYGCAPQLSYIYGPSGAGKSIAIEDALQGRRNVICITLRNNASRESLMAALGIKKRATEVQVPEIMFALRNVLRKVKQQQLWGKEANPRPIIVMSDYISNDPNCKIIAGSILQFVEEQLASGAHVSSNHTTYSELRKLSGHISNLNKYMISYATREELETHPFLRTTRSKDVR